ncbi:MAG: putative Ig domain-containing protein [Turicibacter sp.]|nr:putative Ig domain-containing protein [Turicibacter sp.]
MLKKVISTVLVISLLLANVSFPIMATEVGSTGTVINGDYVVIVNTNADPNNKQSTGTLFFDNKGDVTRLSVEKDEEQLTDLLSEVNEVEEENQISYQNSIPSVTYQIGEKRQFYQGKTYVCIGVFDKSYIWMEESMKADYDTLGKTAEIAEDMRATYESQPYDVLMELTNNQFPYNDGSGKLSILLEQTYNGSSGFYAGEADITAIHINTPQAANYKKGQLSSTNGLLVHEGQHAIFRNLVCGGDATLANNLRWFDEGLAVAAMDYVWGGTDPSGWLSFIEGNTQLRNGASLVYHSYRGSSALDYSMQDLFVRYLANQMTKGYNPIKFFQTVYTVDAKGKDVEAFMNDLFKTANLKDDTGAMLTFDKALQQFYTAIIAQEKDGVYGFYGDPVILKKVANYPLYMGENGKSVTLPGTAAIVVKTENGQFTVPTDGGADIRYIAVNKSTMTTMPEKGAGTVEDPYQIESISDLLTIGLEPSAHFILTKDLDFTGSPYISAESFRGVLDGQGHSIKGLTQPLIEKNNGKVQNLTIEANFNGDYLSYIGAVADINEGTITNCSVRGNFDVQLTGTQVGVVQTFGALVGRNEVAGVIRESSVDAMMNVTVGAQHAVVGALVGKNSGTIENSYSQGILNVYQSNTGAYTFYVGGITGELIKDMGMGAILKNCYSTTDITTSASSQFDLQAIGRLYGHGKNLSSTNVTASYALEGMNAVGKTDCSVNTKDYEKSDSELKQAATYENWPFGVIWKINEGIDYPTFTTGADIKNLTVVLSPSEQERYIGEDISLFTAKLLVNGIAIPLTEDMVNGFDSSTAGVKKVKGTYKGQPFSFEITVKEPTTVTDLEVYKTGQTAYIQGDRYSSEGVVLRATLDGQQNRYIKVGFTSDLEGQTLDNETKVTFNYCGYEVTQDITVTKDEPHSLLVVRPMTKTSYLEDERLDFSGLGIQITYTSGKTSNVLDFSELESAGIRLVWDQNGTFNEVDVLSPLTLNQNGATLYACFGDENPDQFGAIYKKIDQIEVKDRLYLNDQAFVLGQNVYADVYTDNVSGGTAPYTFKLVEGALPAGIVLKNSSYLDYLRFSGTPTEVGETKVVYEITDALGNVTYANIFFIVEEPSNKVEVESFHVINFATKETYPAVINGTDIQLIFPDTVTDVGGFNPQIKLSDGSTYQNILPPAIKLGTQDFTIVAQDGVTTQTYTLTVKIATPDMQQLSVPQNLDWDNQTMLTWDAVPNAQGYIVMLTPDNDVAYTVSTTNTYFDLSTIDQKSDDITIRVFAIGDNVTTYTSLAAETKVSYTAPPKVTYMRITPEVVEVTKGQTQLFKVAIAADQQADKTVTWSIEGATSSHTSINSNGVLTVGVDETAKELQVIATSNQSPNKQVKATVLLKEIPRLSAPAQINWNNKVATWAAVENAVGYRVTLFKDGQQQGTSIEVKGLEYDFSGNMKDSGLYTFTVVALGDGLNILDSLPTTSIQLAIREDDLADPEQPGKPEEKPELPEQPEQPGKPEEKPELPEQPEQPGKPEEKPE